MRTVIIFLANKENATLDARFFQITSEIKLVEIISGV